MLIAHLLSMEFFFFLTFQHQTAVISAHHRDRLVRYLFSIQIITHTKILFNVPDLFSAFSDDVKEQFFVLFQIAYKIKNIQKILIIYKLK